MHPEPLPNQGRERYRRTACGERCSIASPTLLPQALPSPDSARCTRPSAQHGSRCACSGRSTRSARKHPYDHSKCGQQSFPRARGHDSASRTTPAIDNAERRNRAAHSLPGRRSAAVVANTRRRPCRGAGQTPMDRPSPWRDPGRHAPAAVGQPEGNELSDVHAVEVRQVSARVPAAYVTRHASLSPNPRARMPAPLL
jgi:hypothetical protein